MQRFDECPKRSDNQIRPRLQQSAGLLQPQRRWQHRLMTKLSGPTITLLASAIKGDTAPFPGRSGRDIELLFAECQLDATYPGGTFSKSTFARDTLVKYNGDERLKAVIEALADPREFPDDGSAESAVQYLNKKLEYDELRLQLRGHRYRLIELDSLGIDSTFTQQIANPTNREFIEQSLEKAQRKLQTGDYDGAITNSRSLLESVVLDLREQLEEGEVKKMKGDLKRSYAKLAALLHLHPAEQEDAGLRKVLSGLSSVVDGICTARNALSDAHARRYRVDRHHAQVVVSAAATVANFLVASLEYQRGLGVLEPRERPTR